MRQKDLFGVHYFKIQYGKVYKLLTSLGVETLSVFIDGGLEYSFYGLLTIDDFMDNVPQIKESLLIFSGHDLCVLHCNSYHDWEIGPFYLVLTTLHSLHGPKPVPKLRWAGRSDGSRP